MPTTESGFSTASLNQIADLRFAMALAFFSGVLHIPSEL
jgi:hypothetical protein